MADTLREYLIALGFRIDDASWRKFASAVANTAKQTAEFGSIAIEAATAIELMVARIGRQYEALYYMSRRTGQSVGYIQQTQFAFKQIGLSAEDATDAVEGFATTMRTQPWLRVLFGGAKTEQEVVKNLSKSGLPYFLQAQFAQMAGISEKTFLHQQMFGAEDEKAEADFARRQHEAGVNADFAAKRFTDFSRVLNTLESDFDLLGSRIALDWVDPTQAGIRTLDDVVQWFNRADNATKGFIGTLATLATTLFGGLLGTKVLGKFLGFNVPAMALGGKGARFGLWGIATGMLGAMKNDKDHSLRSRLRAAFGIDETPEEAAAPAPWETGGATAAGPPTGSQDVQGRLDQAIKFFESNGFSANAARGIASALFFESGRTLSPEAFNPAGGGQGAVGIGQWRGERIGQFRKMFGKDLSKATFAEQLQYVLWEMTQGTDKGALSAGYLLRDKDISAGRASSIFLNGFERPGPGGAREVSDAASFADRLSALAAQQNGGGDTTNHVTINQKTDIHVSGDSAATTADKVEAAQDRVGQNTVRALIPVIR